MSIYSRLKIKTVEQAKALSAKLQQEVDEARATIKRYSGRLDRDSMDRVREARDVGIQARDDLEEVEKQLKELEAAARKKA